MNEPTASSLMDLMRFVTSKLVVTMSALNHLQLSSFSAHFFSFRPLVPPSSALASFPLHPSVLPLSPLYPPCPPSSRSFSSRGGKCCSYTFNFHCAGIPEICNISTLCAYEPEIEGRTPHTFSICVLKHDYTHSCLIYCPSIIKTWLHVLCVYLMLNILVYVGAAVSMWLYLALSHRSLAEEESLVKMCWICLVWRKILFTRDDFPLGSHNWMLMVNHGLGLFKKKKDKIGKLLI